MNLILIQFVDWDIIDCYCYCCLKDVVVNDIVYIGNYKHLLIFWESKTLHLTHLMMYVSVRS